VSQKVLSLETAPFGLWRCTVDWVTAGATALALAPHVPKGPVEVAGVRCAAWLWLW